MTPELREQIVAAALEPQRIRWQFFCRLCPAVSSSRDTQEIAGTHHLDCPKRAVLEAQP